MASSTGNNSELENQNNDDVVEIKVSIGRFKIQEYILIQFAHEDPNQFDAFTLRRLASLLMKRAMSNLNYVQPIVCYFIHIIQHETSRVFLQALSNIAILFFNERHKLIFFDLPVKNTTTRVRFINYIAFLADYFVQLRRIQFKHSPDYVLLKLILKCCEDIIRAPFGFLPEVQYVFDLMCCLGSEMQTVLPKKDLDRFVALIRNVFISKPMICDIRHVLLQLIELSASDWKLTENFKDLCDF